MHYTIDVSKKIKTREKLIKHRIKKKQSKFIRIITIYSQLEFEKRFIVSSFPTLSHQSEKLESMRLKWRDEYPHFELYSLGLHKPLLGWREVDSPSDLRTA